MMGIQIDYLNFYEMRTTMYINPYILTTVWISRIKNLILIVG